MRPGQKLYRQRHPPSRTNVDTERRSLCTQRRNEFLQEQGHRQSHLRGRKHRDSHKIVDRNGGYTIIPELHIASLTEKQKAHVLPLQANPPAQRHVSILIKEDFIRERMVNAVIDTLKSIIPASMLEKRLSSHSVKLRHTQKQ